MLRKTIAFTALFMLVFCTGVNAMTLNVPKEEYYTNMAYSNVSPADENADFLYRLIFLGIIDNFEFDGDLTHDVISDIIKKAFNVKSLGTKTNFASNQELVKVLCETLELEGVDGTHNIRGHLDYGLIDKEYLPYYEAYAKGGYIEDKKMLLRPNKPVTYNSLLKMLAGCENEIFSANGAKVISGEVKRISYVNTVKTINVETDDYDVDIPLKKGRQTAYISDGKLSFITDVKSGEYVDMLVNGNNEIVLIENSANKIDRIPNVEGIYKAKIYLYDYINGKIIFNNLQKYNGIEFVDIEGKYTEFKISDTANLYEYYRKTNGYYINRYFLDINAYFIVDTNLKGENEIIYLNIVN